MLSQEQRKSLEEALHIPLYHCQSFHHLSHQSGFGFGCIAGDERAGAADSLRRPTPSLPSTPCLNSRLTPAPECHDVQKRKSKRHKDF